MSNAAGIISDSGAMTGRSVFFTFTESGDGMGDDNLIYDFISSLIG